MSRLWAVGLLTVTCALLGGRATCDEAKDKKQEEMGKAIKESLPTKPSSVKVVVGPNDAFAGSDVTLVTLEYESTKSLGYKGFKVQAMHTVAKGKPQTTTMASFANGEKETKVVTLFFDEDGKEFRRMEFEIDKDKLAAVEKRCIEIEVALRKAIPKEPRK
jgi:hypothetical protein